MAHGSLHATAAGAIRVASPDGRVRFEVLLRDQAQLSYQVTFRNKPVIETSPMSISLDEVDLGQGVEFGKAET